MDDLGEESEVVTVTITIIPVNDAPIVTDLSFPDTARNETVILEDTPIVLAQLAGFDSDNDPLTFSVISQPTNGQLVNLVATSGKFTYIPNPNFFGQDTFTFTASDGQEVSGLGTAAIAITSVNDLPILTIIGSTTERFLLGTNYHESGVTAQDVEDGDITNNITVVSSVDTEIAGTYSVVYSVTDADLGTTSIERIVLIIDPVNDVDMDGILNLLDVDIDGDGIINFFDPDIDGDGILNTIDNDDDADKMVDKKDSDPSGVGSETDLDNDGIVNTLDKDIDGDGLVNNVDPDIDGDGILNTIDTDDDADGQDDGVDATPSGLDAYDFDSDGVLNDLDPDMDGDGIINLFDIDTDGDGILNITDTDDDNDDIPDERDSSSTGRGTHEDFDGDTILNHQDNDLDGDGLLNDVDVDTDGDGEENSLDLDDDNDRLLDTEDVNPFSFKQNTDSKTDTTNATSSGGGSVVPFIVNVDTKTTTQIPVQLGTTTQGIVLGVSTSREVYLDLDGGYLARGENNDPQKVILLKKFLNKNLGINLPLNGFFGPLTEQAVKNFQLKYKKEILDPWGIDKPTGIVYITTLNHINFLESGNTGNIIDLKNLKPITFIQ